MKIIKKIINEEKEVIKELYQGFKDIIKNTKDKIIGFLEYCFFERY